MSIGGIVALRRAFVDDADCVFHLLHVLRLVEPQEVAPINVYCLVEFCVGPNSADGHADCREARLTMSNEEVISPDRQVHVSPLMFVKLVQAQTDDGDVARVLLPHQLFQLAPLLHPLGAAGDDHDGLLSEMNY